MTHPWLAQEVARAARSMATRSPGARAEERRRAQAARGTALPQTQGARALCAPSQPPRPDPRAGDWHAC
eukprot:13706831-Alexandrium_andersonii.AAC.1